MLVLLNKKFFHSEPNSKSTEFHELFLIWQKPSDLYSQPDAQNNSSKNLTQDELNYAVLWVLGREPLVPGLESH